MRDLLDPRHLHAALVRELLSGHRRNGLAAIFVLLSLAICQSPQESNCAPFDLNTRTFLPSS